MKRTILSVAVLVACASQASAGLTARYLLEGDKTFAEDITCAVASNFGIYAHGSGNAGTFTGQTISVDVSEAAGLATGVYAGKGGKIVIGDRDKSVVTIRTKDTGVVKDSLSYPASRQKITQSPETKQTLLLKALFNRGFFLVHLGSPWNAALTFKKKYRSSRKP